MILSVNEIFQGVEKTGSNTTMIRSNFFACLTLRSRQIERANWLIICLSNYHCSQHGVQFSLIGLPLLEHSDERPDSKYIFFDPDEHLLVCMEFWTQASYRKAKIVSPWVYMLLVYNDAGRQDQSCIYRASHNLDQR